MSMIKLSEYAIIEGQKYEAVNGVLEVKLPAKTGMIPVIIGNAGTKAGAFSVTIATPSEDNSDTEYCDRSVRHPDGSERTDSRRAADP